MGSAFISCVSLGKQQLRTPLPVSSVVLGWGGGVIAAPPSTARLQKGNAWVVSGLIKPFSHAVHVSLFKCQLLFESYRPHHWRDTTQPPEVGPGGPPKPSD